jgi:hypothetical protein
LARRDPRGGVRAAAALRPWLHSTRPARSSGLLATRDSTVGPPRRVIERLRAIVDEIEREPARFMLGRVWLTFAGRLGVGVA